MEKGFSPNSNLEGNDKQERKSDKEGGSVSRRSFLVGTLLGTTAMLTGSSQKEVTQTTVNPLEILRPKAPHILAQEVIDKKIREIQNDPTVALTKKAREELHAVTLGEDKEGLGIFFYDAVMGNKIITIPSVKEMRTHLYDKKELSYTFRTEPSETQYVLRVSDMYKDIGVSSRLSVQEVKNNKGEDKMVLAVKRARYLQGEGRYGEYVTYTPAHANLRTPSVIRYGKEYVDTVIDEATKLFTARTIDKKILAMSVEVARRVAVIEHIDPYEFSKKAKEGGKQPGVLYDIALAEYSLNPGTAYNHLINGVGAGGMMQIIPKTYRDVRKQIIEMGWFKADVIPEDSNEGRKSPLVSAIISISLSYLNYQLKAKLLGTLKDEDVLLVLASMYNGSPNLLNKILGESIPSKVLRQIKKKIHKEPSKKPQSIKEKLLSNGKGNKLAGTGETENENYIKKFIAYDTFVRPN